MLITCHCNEGFEDMLTPGKEYRAADIRHGSVLVDDDTGRRRWFGLGKFTLVAL